MAHEAVRRAAGLLVVSALTLAGPARAQTPEADGGEFRVNAFTTGAQTRPAVASDSSGNFVVVWVDTDLMARRFDAGGGMLGSEFLVNSYRTGLQIYPQVTRGGDGAFVVVWESQGEDGSGAGIFGRRFDSGGAPLGPDFRVNSYTTGNQGRPKIARDAAGSFVVVWHSDGQDGDNYGVFGRRFDSGGSPLGSDFQVNSYTTNVQMLPSIATDAGGGFLVVWEGRDPDGRGVVGRRFDSGGNPLGPDFQVNAYVTNYQTRPAVATDAGGNFVVVWVSNNQDGSGYGVFGRRFDAAGSALGSEFLVNAYTTGFQRNPRIATDTVGNLVVVWQGNGQDGDNYGVLGRRLDSAGHTVGAEFIVNTYTPNGQAYPEIAMTLGGSFVVVWNSFYQDGSGQGVYGQRFVPSDYIFADGVESGDLTRWSSAVTDGTDLRPTAAAGMAGTAFGIQALVNDTNSLYVVDDTPTYESRYRARFYFDPNGFDPGEASSHFRTRIFIAFDPSGLRVITVVLKRQGGAYSLETRVRRNDGTRADTGFVPISDGPHFVELDWQRATGPGVSDGALEMWIDDTFASLLVGIDNDLSYVDFARLGALAIKTGAAGTLYFDQFESRRRSYVGP
jgi:hypothetical protein